MLLEVAKLKSEHSTPDPYGGRVNIQRLTLTASVKDKDFFSTYTAGKIGYGIVPFLATLPETLAGVTATGLAELGLMYSDYRNEGTIDEALKDTAIDGTLMALILLCLGAVGYLGRKYWNSLGDKSAGKLITQLQKNYLDNPTAIKEFEDYYKNVWTTIIDGAKTSPNIDKAQALVNYLDINRGTKLQAEASSYSNKVANNINRTEAKAEEIVVKEANLPTDITEKNLDAIKQPIDNTKEFLSARYDDIYKEASKIKIGKDDADILVYYTKDDTIFDGLEATQKTAVKEVTDAVKLNTVGGLMVAYKGLNELKNTRVINKKELKELQLEVEGVIKDKLDSAGKSDLYEGWLNTNESYSSLLGSQKTEIGKILEAVSPFNNPYKRGEKHPISGEPFEKRERAINIEVALDKLNNITEGEKSFKYLDDIVGEKKVSDFEKLTIAKLLRDHNRDINLINESIKKKGFVSKEGKELQDLVDRVNKVVRGKAKRISDKESAGSFVRNKLVKRSRLINLLKSPRIFKELTTP